MRRGNQQPLMWVTVDSTALFQVTRNVSYILLSRVSPINAMLHLFSSAGAFKLDSLDFS